LNLPFGQLPTLEIDGVVYAQTFAIARYLAEKYGLAGKSDLDKLRADMIICGIEDSLNQMVKVYTEENKETKEKLLKKFKEEELPASSANLEKMLKQNHGGDGYLVGDSLTWADMTLQLHVTYYVSLVGIDPTFIDPYPKLKALVDRVSKHPKIAAWIEKHPIKHS